MSTASALTFLLIMICLVALPSASASVVLVVSQSVAFGRKNGLEVALVIVFGDLCFVVAALLGMSTLVEMTGELALVLKALGGVYLIWLGLRMIRRAKPEAGVRLYKRQTASLRSLWLQGFLTSAANPKAVVFFAALFSQFISDDAAFWPQFLILTGTYIVIDGLFLSAYGLGSSWVLRRFKSGVIVWVERLGGSFMIVAAILLGLKSIAR